MVLYVKREVYLINTSALLVYSQRRPIRNTVDQVLVFIELSLRLGLKWPHRKGVPKVCCVDQPIAICNDP